MTASDLSDFVEFLQQLYAHQHLDAFARCVVSTLPTLVPSDITSYNEVNPARRRLRWIVYPPDALDFPGSQEAFERHMPEHPLIAHYARTNDGRALKISDFLSQGQFHRLGIYNEFYRRRSVERQMAVTLPAPRPLVIGIALNRGRHDFSERDRLLLNLLRPHLVQAYRNAEVVTQFKERMLLQGEALDAFDLATVTLGRDRRVLDPTPRARQWLERYFGRPQRRMQRLPEALDGWLRQQQAPLADGQGVPRAREPLVVEREGLRLVARLIDGGPASLGTGQALLVLQERAVGFAPGSLEALGLSRREAEVVAWVAEGKSNDAIGAILGISGRTVQKHLERIYRKLGVESRTAAVARAHAAVLSPMPAAG